jgi:MFS family permease
MQVMGVLIDRWGSRLTAIVGCLVLAVGVLLPGFAQDAWGVGIALFVLGFGEGAVDVSMNDQAVRVERGWNKPIMSSLHAFFSVGAVAGAGVGALMQSFHLHLFWSLGFGAVVVLGVMGASLRYLLPPGALSQAAAVEPAAAEVPAREIRRRIVALAGLAFFLMLAEGVANDWSALHAVQEIGASEAVGSLAFAAFALAMTIGRFFADRISYRYGPVRVVRYGSAVAAGGILIVITSTVPPVTLAGWLVFGLGLSGTVPQLFTAAGNLGAKDQGQMMARVVSAGYVGLLAGPAVIGWISHLTGLSAALFVPFILCVAGAFLARSAAPLAPQPYSRTGQVPKVSIRA